MMSRQYRCLLLLLPSAALAFRTVVDINQLNATEAVGAAALVADGLWFTAVNSPPTINFTQVTAVRLDRAGFVAAALLSVALASPLYPLLL